MVGQKQVSVFSHVETTRGMGQVNISVGESSNYNTYCHKLFLFFFLHIYAADNRMRFISTSRYCSLLQCCDNHSVKPLISTL